MARQSKRYRDNEKSLTPDKKYSVSEAVEQLQQCQPVKFDQTVEIALKLGVDPRKSDQNVRGTVTLPHGTGKTIRILVFASGPKAKEALDAGADYAGDEEYFAKVKGGWINFDAVIATPDMMREVGKLGKILGPRGLMPTPKAGTVTTEVAKAVGELQGGKIEFKVDRHGVINVGVGKLSFDLGKLVGNIQTLVDAVSRAKPPGAKGHYFQSMALSSTMGPGLSVDLRTLEG
ncbi:MAG: 50S ribosomal protein L1 [Waddliaceae bacterium]